MKTMTVKYISPKKIHVLKRMNESYFYTSNAGLLAIPSNENSHATNETKRRKRQDPFDKGSRKIHSNDLEGGNGGRRDPPWTKSTENWNSKKRPCQSNQIFGLFTTRSVGIATSYRLKIPPPPVFCIWWPIGLSNW